MKNMKAMKIFILAWLAFSFVAGVLSMIGCVLGVWPPEQTVVMAIMAVFVISGSVIEALSVWKL